MPKLVTDASGASYAVPDEFDHSQWGAAESSYDPNAPLAAASALPPPDAGGMSGAENMSAYPGPTPGGPPPPPPPQVPVNTGPVQIEPVSVQGSPTGSTAVPNVPVPQPVDPTRGLDALSLAQGYGVKRVGGTAARPGGWVDISRQGHFDPSAAAAGIDSAYEAQRDAAWQTGGAALQQNDAEIAMHQRREQQLEQMQLEQARKNTAVREQVDKDRQEYERLKQEHRDAEAKGGNILGTPGGALSTIFGMLAIGLAAKGSRENLNATINAVNGNIDRQVQAQRAANAAKGQAAENAYSRYLKSYGNDEQAQAATKALMTERAMAELDRMAAQSRDPAIQAQTAEAIAKLKAERDRSLGMLEMESQGKGLQQYQQARAATRGGLVPLTLEEQMKLAKFNADTTGQNLQNEKTFAETAKLRSEAQGVASKEDLKDFEKPLAELGNANKQLGTITAAIEAIKAKKEGENFAGMDDSSITPASAAFTGALERTFRPSAARDNTIFDRVSQAMAHDAFGAYNPQQGEYIDNKIRADGSKEGALKALEELKAETERNVQEIKSRLPQGVEGASDERRQQTGASRNTVAQPGRAL